MLVKFLLATLACYRVVQLVVFDDGPFRLMDRIRVGVGCYEYGEDSQPQTILGRLLSCPYCVGMWMAIPLAFIVAERMSWEIGLWWLAVAGGQAFLENVSSRKDGD